MNKSVKYLAIVLAGIVLSNFAFGDEVDDQIQKLEKENKLLELQKKKKELERDNSNLSTSTNSNKKQKISNKSDNSKSGWFVGVEGDIGSVSSTFTTDSLPQSSTVDIKSLVSQDYSGKINKGSTFDLGLVSGYQHYFGESQRHGIKVSAHIYSGFGNSWKWNNNISSGSVLKYYKQTMSYIPIKFGLDVKYLWDFLQVGKHTLGLNVGLGWQGNMYFGKITNEFEYEFSKDITHVYSEIKLNTLFANSFYPVLGLHYYYGHNQFELMYRFGGAILGDGYAKTQDLNGGGGYIIHNTIHYNSYLTFNYAYRF